MKTFKMIESAVEIQNMVFVYAVDCSTGYVLGAGSFSRLGQASEQAIRDAYNEAYRMAIARGYQYDGTAPLTGSLCDGTVWTPPESEV